MNDVNTGGVSARFCITRGGFTLDVALEIPARGVTAIFGPSGAGKTTLLRALAGLERFPGGFLQIAGETWQDESRNCFVPPHRRAVGYVFQEANLFPHLDVSQNLGYAMRRRRENGHVLAHDEVVDLLGIRSLLTRGCEKLSGGERQRVAIARALLAGPRLLLLDEPLASIDIARKHEILPYLERIHDTLGIPVVLVSHAIDEVKRVADFLVLLEQGRIVGSGPLGAMLASVRLPESLTVDPCVILDGRVGEYDAGYALLRLDVGEAHLFIAHAPVAVGQPMRAEVRARDVSLSLARPEATSIVNVLPVEIVEVAPEQAHDGAHVLVLLECSGTRLLARITRFSCERLRLVPGQQACAQIKAVAVIA